jgi:pimeloyl-ACP methyl ester carboxylesterase
MATYLGEDESTLHYEDRGSGEALVYLAGGAGRHPDYLTDFGGLGEGHRVIVPYLRSVGMSPVPLDPQRGSYWYQAQDLEALRSHLGLEQLVIVAHSAGTRLAIAYASQYPDLVDRMILITPPADYIVSVEPDDEEIRARRLGEPLYDDALTLLLSGSRATTDDELTAWGRATAPIGYASWSVAQKAHAQLGIWSYRASADFRSVDPPSDLASRLARVTAPVLVIVGSEDGLTGMEPVAAVAFLFAQGSSAIIQEAGHYPWIERPADFLAVAKTFLADLAQRTAFSN